MCSLAKLRRGFGLPTVSQFVLFLSPILPDEFQHTIGRQGLSSNPLFLEHFPQPRFLDIFSRPSTTSFIIRYRFGKPSSRSARCRTSGVAGNDELDWSRRKCLF